MSQMHFIAQTTTTTTTRQGGPRAVGMRA